MREIETYAPYINEKYKINLRKVTVYASSQFLPWGMCGWWIHIIEVPWCPLDKHEYLKTSLCILSCDLNSYQVDKITNTTGDSYHGNLC